MVKQKVLQKPGLFNIIFRILRNYIVFLAVVLIAGYIMLAGGMRADEVEIPSFVNMNITDAQRLINKTHLQINLVRQHSNSVEKEKIISQWPPEGMLIKNTGNRKVTLYVSDGPELITMPNVMNIPYGDALNILRNLQMRSPNLNLNIKEPVRTYNEVVQEGYVISQTPSSGELISSSTNITLVISSGKETLYIEVPDLNGLDLTDATQKVNELHLICETAPLYNIHRPPNIVLKQEPAPGEKLAQYSTVKLYYNSISAEQVSQAPKTLNYTYITPNYVGARRVRLVLEDANGERMIYDNIEPSGKYLLLKLNIQGAAKLKVYIDNRLEEIKNIE